MFKSLKFEKKRKSQSMNSEQRKKISRLHSIDGKKGGFFGSFNKLDSLEEKFSDFIYVFQFLIATEAQNQLD
jgi:hypothetical protein